MGGAGGGRGVAGMKSNGLDGSHPPPLSGKGQACYKKANKPQVVHKNPLLSPLFR